MGGVKEPARDPEPPGRSALECQLGGRWVDTSSASPPPPAQAEAGTEAGPGGATLFLGPVRSGDRRVVLVAVFRTLSTHDGGVGRRSPPLPAATGKGLGAAWSPLEQAGPEAGFGLRSEPAFMWRGQRPTPRSWIGGRAPCRCILDRRVRNGCQPRDGSDRCPMVGCEPAGAPGPLGLRSTLPH